MDDSGERGENVQARIDLDDVVIIDRSAAAERHDDSTNKKRDSSNVAACS